MPFFSIIMFRVLIPLLSNVAAHERKRTMKERSRKQGPQGLVEEDKEDEDKKENEQQECGEVTSEHCERSNRKNVVRVIRSSQQSQSWATVQ